jgi:hypothetical protein
VTARAVEPVSGRWIPEGRRFAAEEIIYFAGRGKIALRDALQDFDLLITGPHATAMIPEELRPFLDPDLTCREQFDFSDISTSAIGRRWAAIDSRVVYVENPHPRLVLDPNRPPPHDLEAGLREAFSRIRRAGPGQPVELDGVDAVRPVTFAFKPVLMQPRDPADWRRLVATLRDCSSVGADVYAATRDRLLEALLRLRRGARPGLPMLHVMSLHDTMGARCRSDGAITNMRLPSERLPALVSLGNRGDAQGKAIRGFGSTTIVEATTIAPEELRRITVAFRRAVGIPPGLGAYHVAMNRAYTGGWETIAAANKVRAAAESLGPAWPSRWIGSYMAEFAREALLDLPALMALGRPGHWWPRQSFTVVNKIAELLKAAYDRLRTDL